MLFTLTLVATLSLLVGITYFGNRKPAYSHLRNTISELGEQGSLMAPWVNYGLFLSVGVLLLVVAIIAHQKAEAGMAACIGIGYVTAAFFPCDVGSPSSGSWRQGIHNIGGAIEYLGGAYWISQFTIKTSPLIYPSNNFIIGVILVGTVLLSIDKFAWRGLVQRVVEVILFGILLTAVWPH